MAAAAAAAASAVCLPSPKLKQNDLDGKNTSGCGFTHEVQEKQQPLCGSCRQLDGFEIGHVMALPEAREISGWPDPPQVFLFLVLMDSRRQSNRPRRHNTAHIYTSMAETSIQIRISSVSASMLTALFSLKLSFSIRRC